MFFFLSFLNAESSTLPEDLPAFYFSGDIDFPQKYCCATKNVFTYLTVTGSFIPHAERFVAFQLQNGYAKVPQCFIIRTLPILLRISTYSD